MPIFIFDSDSDSDSVTTYSGSHFIAIAVVICLRVKRVANYLTINLIVFIYFYFGIWLLFQGTIPKVRNRQ